MEIKPPKELVKEANVNGKNKVNSAFDMKSKSTISGAFYGGGIGLLYGMYKGKKIYITTIIGALIGGFVSNILTVKKED